MIGNQPWSITETFYSVLTPHLLLYFYFYHIFVFPLNILANAYTGQKSTYQELSLQGASRVSGKRSVCDTILSQLNNDH